MMLNRNTLSISGGILVVTFLALFIVFGLRAVMPHDSILHAKVSPRIIQQSDSLHFYDSTEFAKSYKWLFGDGTFATTQSGYHRYKAPGNYVVSLTVNNQFKDSFFVRVQGAGYTYNAQDSVFKIVGPPAALQGENIMFRVDGYGSDEFVWDFGDKSNQITTTLSVVQHTYKKPGVYQVSLFSKNNTEPYKHSIIISSKYDLVDTAGIFPAATGGNMAAENDFKLHLQKIIDGGNFDQHYNYLLRKYMCNNARITLKINDQKTFEFYTYCQNLRFNSNLIIQSVQLTFADKNRCVVMANIVQGNR
ncbi:MAG: PKD domain-containing protein [Taibaiella sp.]|jgi:hypothetical protein